VPGPLRDEAALSVADQLAIHDLLARYGHLIDEGAFDRLEEVFTEDATYDAADFDLPVWNGLAEIVRGMRGSTQHPLAHHTTNVVIGAPEGDEVSVHSKGIGVGVGGRVGSVTYVDVARRTPRGWRLSRRVVLLRRPGQRETGGSASPGGPQVPR